MTIVVSRRWSVCANERSLAVGSASAIFEIVMAGLVPAIHGLLVEWWQGALDRSLWRGAVP
jgi:hypothetical protein